MSRNAATWQGKTYDVSTDLHAPFDAKVRPGGGTGSTVALRLSAQQDGANRFVVDGIAYMAGNTNVLAHVGYGLAMPICLAPAVVSGPPATSPTASKPKMFDTSSVGPGVAVKPMAGKLSPKSNTTIEGLAITGMVNLSNLSGVVIRNCRIDAGGAPYGIETLGSSGIRIEHCEIFNCNSAGVYGQGFSAQSNVVHHSAGDGFKPVADAIIAGNWVHHLGYNSPGAHADGVQMRGGSNVQISGNYFDLGIDVPNTHSNSSLMIQLDASNVSFIGNWCRGGNWILNGDAGPGCVCSKNVFFRNSARYGFSCAGGMTWTPYNTFDDGSPCTPGDQ